MFMRFRAGLILTLFNFQSSIFFDCSFIISHQANFVNPHVCTIFQTSSSDFFSLSHLRVHVNY